MLGGASQPDVTEADVDLAAAHWVDLSATTVAVASSWDGPSPPVPVV